jgi:formate dehydrogenase major subunit
MAKRRPRLTTPYVRRNGSLEPATWGEALGVAAVGLETHRGAAHGMFSCSKATNEVNFLAQKFTRVVMGSNNIDSCNRT